ncbi:MAG: GGDEF domain-containing protein [Deltaproteobacteria bacterium]|nr:GGDEF domain-containing protein [Deltaproteobacteria bacterium]
MQKDTLKKALSENIGRNFNMVFNQVAMYNVHHKSGAGAIDRFLASLQEGWQRVPSIAISMSKERFFVEEEPLNQRVNTFRMAAHFKKAGIESISFDRDLSREDLTYFLEVITDLNTYSNINAMKRALNSRGVDGVRINYVIFRKVSEDEEVVRRDQLDGKFVDVVGENRVQESSMGGILDVMVSNIISDEFGKNLTVPKLMEGPSALCSLLIDSDLAAANRPEKPNLSPGESLFQGLQQFRHEVDTAMNTRSDLNMADLARNVFELKKKLIEGVDKQKARGVVYLDEAGIRREVDEITDNVLVRLIQEEYNKGAVSVKRLAGIIIRLVPSVEDLRRILPKVKKTLVSAGMPLSEFLQLVQELKQELQSDELARALERGAGEIGLDGEELVQEIMAHPDRAAELICLAAEIRRTGNDEKILSELLVEYVERIGTGLAASELESEGGLGGEEARRVFRRIRSGLVDNLRTQKLDASMMADVEKRLVERMETSLRQLKSRMLFKRVSSGDAKKLTKDAVLKMLQSYSDDEREYNEILEQVKSALVEKGGDSGHFDRIYDEMMAESEARQKTDPAKKAPPGTLNRQSILFVIENEIKRSARYETPFSVLSFSIIRAKPRKGEAPAESTLDDVIQAFMSELVKIVRETDVVGRLSMKMVVVMQPMTNGPNSKIALERVSKALKASQIKVKGVPFDIQFAGVSTPFDPESMATLRALVNTAQRNLKTMATRLINLQSLM